MMLSDTGIHTALASGELKIHGPNIAAQVQPASIDLRLGNKMRHLVPNPGLLPWYITPDQECDEWETTIIPAGSDVRLVLPPHGFALVDTLERVEVGPGLAAQVAGKSSLARLGLAVEAAGWVDPGFAGTLTLELLNMTDRWWQLIPGMRIAQLTVHRLDQPARRPYGSPGLGSHYQGQCGPTASRAHERNVT